MQRSKESLKEIASMSEKLKVKTYCINRGQPSQYYGLKDAKEGTVLPYAPNNWKTERGAYGWAKKNGLEVPKSAEKGTKVKSESSKKKAKRPPTEKIPKPSRPHVQKDKSGKVLSFNAGRAKYGKKQTPR